jgi:CIC family chloride channel protein
MWKEYRLLLYSALIGVAGGLGAQLFVWLLNFSERLLLVGIAGYKPPEPGTLNPQAIIGPWGLWLIPVATTLGGVLSGILVYTLAPEAEDTEPTRQWKPSTSKMARLDPSCQR